jgi:hypothetical protein
MADYGKLKVPLKKKVKKNWLIWKLIHIQKKGSSIKWSNHVVDTFISIHKDMEEEFIKSTKRKACI